jgi:hypothetical protein
MSNGFPQSIHRDIKCKQWWWLSLVLFIYKVWGINISLRDRVVFLGLIQSFLCILGYPKTRCDSFFFYTPPNLSFVIIQSSDAIWPMQLIRMLLNKPRIHLAGKFRDEKFQPHSFQCHVWNHLPVFSRCIWSTQDAVRCLLEFRCGGTRDVVWISTRLHTAAVGIGVDCWLAVWWC